MIRSHWRYPAERQLFRTLSWIVLGSRRRVHIEGRENLPETGPAIVVGNHVGTIDPPLVCTQLRRRDVYCMAKAEAFRTRFGRFILTGWNAFPVVRHTADRRALDHALRIVREGHVLVLFPEGSRSRDGTLSRGLPGAGFIALRSGVPVIPVAIWGSERVLAKGSLIPHSADVFVRIGRPMTVARTGPDGRRRSSQDAVDLMLREIASMLPDGRRGAYDDRPGEPGEHAGAPTAA